ncbi:MAG TPA: TlpA disulfide reductase family protein [Bryobacteraceae bacterium]|jgi:thiol-disulfide isomerase/thioredoxin
MSLVLARSLIAALCLAGTPLMFPQAETVGTLKPELVPNRVHGQTEPLELATSEELAAFPILRATGARVFFGATSFRANAPIKLALIEPVVGAPYLFADVNQNGSFEANERFSFEGSPREVVLNIPIIGRYHYYPIRLFIPEHDLYMRDTSGKAGSIGRTLARSPLAFVEGSVKIGGQMTLVRYMFDLAKDNAYADWGWQGMDTNGDGKIEETANSDEWTFASDENVIFRVNGHDVSTVSLDLASGTFVVREHPAGDNKRIQLHLGDSIPEFSFTDLAGKSHRFSEFHGRYVLLDFWGTWCGPCRAELPNLEKAYRQFRARNFIILGMNDEEESAKVRKVLSDAGVTYPQSTGEAGKDLVHKRFRIDRFPTKALVDPQGKIIALDSDGSFDRQHLLSTLDKLLPPGKSSGESGVGKRAAATAMFSMPAKDRSFALFPQSSNNNQALLCLVWLRYQSPML